MHMQYLSIVFLIASAYFFIATAAGMFRFQTVYARLHSAGKSLTGGAVSIVIFAMLQADSGADIARLAVTTVFLLATSTLGTHAIARASHQASIDLHSLEDDEYARAIEAGFVVGERTRKHDGERHV